MNAFKRLLRTLARPVRRGTEHKGRMIQSYRGYGTTQSLYLMGRVFRQPLSGSIAPEGRFLRDLVRFIRRILRRGAGDLAVVLKLEDREHRASTDRDGYFRFHIDEDSALPVKDGWNTVSLHLDEDPDLEVEAEVFIARSSSEFVVISDIDDTVMRTGVANKLKMFWRLFATGADSRMAFSGVGDFYRALHAGSTGDRQNPMLYLSRAPWSICEMLETFFQQNHIRSDPFFSFAASAWFLRLMAAAQPLDPGQPPNQSAVSMTHQWPRFRCRGRKSLNQRPT